MRHFLVIMYFGLLVISKYVIGTHSTTFEDITTLGIGLILLALAFK